MSATGDRLKREREARGWQPRDVIEAMVATGWEQRTSAENMIRNIRRWEAGGGIEDRSKRALAEAFGLGMLTLFPPESVHDAPDVIDAVEVAERIRRRSLVGATIDQLTSTIDRLCTAYSIEPAEAVLAEASRWLWEIERALGQPTSPDQHRVLFDQAGWLALLIGCLHNDLGRRTEAEAMRVTASQLGADAGNGRVVAWSHEMRAWFSLTDGEYRAAIAAAQAGQQAAPHSDVAVHLAGQEAEAWARLGEEQAALEALDRGRRVLDQLAWPDNPRNHFTVDPPKFRWWRARVARFLGDDELAHHQASEIIAEGLRPDGTHRQPMRVADATATLGAIAAGRGDVDEAVRLGHEALTITERVSKPSLLAVTGEILDLLPNTPAAAELAHQLHEMTAVA